MIPYFVLTADRTDVSSNIRSAGLVQLKVTDNRGVTADDLTIEVNDVGGGVFWPRDGAKLSVAIGFRETGLVPQGEYIVDRVSHAGPVDRVIINAKAADMLESLKVHRQRDWDDVTLGVIVSTIADAHGLRPAISERLAKIQIHHIDQTESDLNFLTRLGEHYNATAKPAGGALVFVDKGAAVNASGQSMPAVIIRRRDGDTHQFDQEGRTTYTGVKAGWQDVEAGKAKYELAGEKGKIKTLRQSYASQGEALDAAKAEYDRLQQSGFRIRIMMPQGRPELRAEMRVTLQGWREELVAVPWVIDSVSHVLHGDSGLATEVNLLKQGQKSGNAQ